MTLCILGRQPELGLTELEAVYGPTVRSFGKGAALVDGIVNLTHLGGTVKTARILDEVASSNWHEVFAFVQEKLPVWVETTEGKIKLGLSAYGLRVPTQSLQSGGLQLKKILRSHGRSVRVIPNKTVELNAAQILHNQLTSSSGMELNFVTDGARTLIAQTLSVQDIEAYTARDHGRPHRDAFVGMLPPKLAQIMINLGTGGSLLTGNEPKTLLDPFCGTGVVLQEATLMGLQVYGTDLDARMVEYSEKNLAWLTQRHPEIRATSQPPRFETADATTHTWQQPINAVVCEAYLGQPLSGLPKPEKLEQIMTNCRTIALKFMKNLHPQIAAGTRLCIAVPAWRTGNGFKHLGIVDQLEKIGYNRVSFSCVDGTNLLYHRADQIVARELLVLTRK